jgi:hypothetical protein
VTGVLSLRLRALHPALYVLVMLAATFVVLVPLVLVAQFAPSLSPGDGSSVMQSSGLMGRLFFGSLVVPLIETLLFQFLPVRLLRRRLHAKWWVTILVSAALFAAWHYYSPGYVIFAFLIGVVLAYCFALRDVPGKHGFVLTFFVHALRNGIVSVLR